MDRIAFILNLSERCVDIRTNPLQIFAQLLKLADAFGLVGWLSSRFQEYEDVEVMNDVDLEEFLKASELLDTQKERMHQREGRGKYYRHISFFHRYQRVETSVREFSVYVNRSFLFMPDALFVKFGMASDLMYKALTTARTGHENDVWSLVTEAADITANEIKPLVGEVQQVSRHLMVAHRKEQQAAAEGHQ